MERLDETLERCGGLTATPVVLTRVATMLANNDPDLSEIESVVRQDPALVSAVFRMANAASEAPSSRITDLNQAIVRIGSKRLVRLVSNHEAGRILPEDVSVYGLEHPQLWRNSIGGAIAARRRLALAPWVAVAYVTQHLSYGAGFLLGALLPLPRQLERRD